MEILTAKEFCDLWHISKPTLMVWLSEGMPHIQLKKNSTIRINMEDAKEWLADKTLKKV